MDASQRQVYIQTYCTGSSLSFEEYGNGLKKMYESFATDSEYLTKELLVSALTKMQFR